MRADASTLKLIYPVFRSFHFVHVSGFPIFMASFAASRHQWLVIIYSLARWDRLFSLLLLMTCSLRYWLKDILAIRGLATAETLGGGHCQAATHPRAWRGRLKPALK